MPTEPIVEFVFRPNHPELEPVLKEFSAKIKETVYFGSHVFKWAMEKKTGGDENIPLSLSFRHILELIDSISCLVKESYIDPCKIILRAILESVLGIEYILEGETQKRSMDFMVWYVHQRLKSYKQLDPSTNLAKEFEKSIESDKWVGKMKIPEFPQLKKAIANLEKLLQKPEYAESEAEYTRLRKLERTKGKIRNWYSFHNGPKNLKELADYVGLSGIYVFLYRTWSGYVHGTDIIAGRISRRQNGRAEIWAIRSPKDAEWVTFFTLTFAIITIFKYVDHFNPEKKNEVALWYVNEIRDFYHEVSRRQIIEVK